MTQTSRYAPTAGGTQILSFGVAVNDRHRNQQTGGGKMFPICVDCVVFWTACATFPASSPRVRRLLLKANFVSSPGETKKEGQRRSKLEVVVDEVGSFLGINRWSPMSGVHHLMRSSNSRAPTPVRLRRTRNSMLIFRFKRQTATQVI